MPTTATSKASVSVLNFSVGMSVPRITSASCGLAISAAPTYANSDSESHRKMLRISTYEPAICSVRTIAAMTMTIARNGTPGIRTFIAAAMPPRSAPASKVLPMMTPMSAG